MGILDRIAGTLDELTGDTDAAAAAEVIARARRSPTRGDLDGAEARAAGGRRSGSRATRRAFAALGELRRAARRAGGRGHGARARGRSRRRRRRGVVRAGRRAGAARAHRAGARRAPPRADAGPRAVRSTRACYAALGRVHARARAVDGGRARAAQGARCSPGRARTIAASRSTTAARWRRLGDREATEWLTRAARAAGRATPRSIVEAAAATADHERAEALLREGLARAARRSGAARGAGAAARARGPHRRGDRARRGVRRRGARATPTALAALRDSYAAAGALERRPARRAPTRPPGRAAAARRRVALALGAEDRAALAALASESDPAPLGARPGEGSDDAAAPRSPRSPPGTPSEADLLRLGRLAPDAPPRATSWCAAPTPPPPAGQLAGLLDLDARPLQRARRALVGLAAAAGHARGGARPPAAGRGDGRVQRRQVVVRERALRRGGRAHRRHADDRDRQRAPLRRRARGARRRATTAARAPLAAADVARVPDRAARRRGARDPDGRDLPARSRRSAASRSSTRPG